MVSPDTRHSLWKASKILVSLGLCLLILLKAEWGELILALQNSNWIFLSAAFAGIVGSVFISAYKWQVLLGVHKISTCLWQLFRYYFTAIFLNNFLPSNIGGDGYRIYKTLSSGKSGAIVAVLIERLSGLWALIVLGGCGTIWLNYVDDMATRSTWIHHLFWLLLAGSLLPLILGTLLISCQPIRERISRLSKRTSVLFERIADYRMKPLTSLYVVALSLFFQLYTLGWMLLLAFAVDAPVSAYKMIIGMTLSSIAALLPISLNGIGVWDGSFIFTMHALGMPYNKALMIMLLIRCALIPMSLIGCFFYLSEKKRLGH